MNIDFPLVLVLLCAAGILIWLFDRLWLAPQRRQQQRLLAERYPQHEQPGHADARAYAAARAGLRGQPALVEFSNSLLPVLLVVLVLRSFLVEPFKIPSSSMEPTLQVGDYILVNKFTYGLRLPVLGTKVVAVSDPQRGDVMVFFPPNDPRYFIKRVIGLPGDHIEYRNKVLYINGEPASQQVRMWLPMEVLAEETLGAVAHRVRVNPLLPAGNFSVIVQPGHYFMMGDNRDNSSDSRVWGPVPEANIVGRAFAVWMHWETLFSLPTFDRVGAIH